MPAPWELSKQSPPGKSQDVKSPGVYGGRGMVMDETDICITPMRRYIPNSMI